MSNEARGTGDATRAAGRGGLAIAGAKVSFIVLGFVQQLILPRLLGTDGYGDASLVLAIVGIVNNVVVATSIQGVSRAVAAADPSDAQSVFRRALKAHGLLALVTAGLFAALASTIASFENAERIVSPLRLVSLVVLLYGVYAPLVGSLNGTRRFGAQASLDVGYQVLRTIGLAGGALFFLRAGMSGVTGATLGFVLAAAVIVPIALTRSGLGKEGAVAFDTRGYLAGLFPLFLGQAFLSLLMQTDFLLLGRFLGESAARAGLAPSEAARFVGVQRGVQLFGFLPYQLLISVSFVLFPMLARAKALANKEEIKGYTLSGVRLSIIVTGVLAAPISALAPHLLRFAYLTKPDIYTLGVEPLRVYSLGMASFAILGVATAALVSLDRARDAALLTATAIVLVAAGSFGFVRTADFGAPMLERSAIATACAVTLATIAAGARLRAVAGGFVALRSLLRALLALAVAVAAGMQFPFLGTHVLSKSPAGLAIAAVAVGAEAAAVVLIYAAVLYVTRELGKDDFDRIARVIGRRR